MIETVQAGGDQVAQLHHGSGRHFLRADPHRRALAYLQALLSPSARNNGWHLLKPASDEP